MELHGQFMQQTTDGNLKQETETVIVAALEQTSEQI